MVCRYRIYLVFLLLPSDGFNTTAGLVDSAIHGVVYLQFWCHACEHTTTMWCYTWDAHYLQSYICSTAGKTVLQRTKADQTGITTYLLHTTCPS